MRLLVYTIDSFLFPTFLFFFSTLSAISLNDSIQFITIFVTFQAPLKASEAEIPPTDFG